MVLMLSRAVALWCVSKLRSRKVAVVLTALVVMVPGIWLRQKVGYIFADHNDHARRVVRTFKLRDNDTYFGFSEGSGEKVSEGVHKSRRAEGSKTGMYRPDDELDIEFDPNELKSGGLVYFRTETKQSSKDNVKLIRLDDFNHDSPRQLQKIETDHPKAKQSSLGFVNQLKHYIKSVKDTGNTENRKITDRLLNGEILEYNSNEQIRLQKKLSDFDYVRRKHPNENTFTLEKYHSEKYKNNGDMNTSEIKNKKVSNKTKSLSKIVSKNSNKKVDTNKINATFFSFKISNEANATAILNENSKNRSKKNIFEEEDFNTGVISNHTDHKKVYQHRGELLQAKEHTKKALIFEVDHKFKNKSVNFRSNIDHLREPKHRDKIGLNEFNSDSFAGQDAVKPGHQKDNLSNTEISCRGVLKRAVVGKWVPRWFSRAEFFAVQNFINKTRDGLGLPSTLQRPDKKCGNVSFGEYTFGDKITYKWFQALCNPQGKTPCCKNNRCVSRTVEQCTCDGCLDMRQQIHAELSNWVPSDTGCELKQYRPGEETCKALEGFTVHFMGDSLLRQIFVAMLRLLNVTVKELKEKDELRRCEGYFSYLPFCSSHLPFVVRTCGDKVILKRSYVTRNAQVTVIIKQMRQLVGQRNSLVVLGMGLHDHLNAKLIIDTVVKPILATASSFNSTWPRLIWVAPHAPGLLKSPWLPSQLAPSVLNFNKHVNAAFTFGGVPVLDTFNLTKDGVMTYDGLHYGEGVNTLKAHILMNYLQEIRK